MPSHASNTEVDWSKTVSKKSLWAVITVPGIDLYSVLTASEKLILTNVLLLLFYHKEVPLLQPLGFQAIGVIERSLAPPPNTDPPVIANRLIRHSMSWLLPCCCCCCPVLPLCPSRHATGIYMELF